MRLEHLAVLNQERAARRAVLLVTDLASGQQRLVKGDDVAADPLADILADRLRLGKSGTVEQEGRSLFINVHVPPVRLVVIGAVHVSQALAELARTVGIDVIIIDPRTAFATSERFPSTRVIAAWPEEVLPDLNLDRFSALAVLTHDPKIDDPALIAGLRSACFYIGALGSRKTHAARCGRLAARQFSDDDLARIHAPIGLDIGAVSPAEIAVSILGEIILALRRKPTRAEATQSEPVG
ncbi:XdhC family protein [Lichenifustis flavocetrariae]|uniref:XdhC family protein n=1 Tax=Lichenifustis flavocetrariae TaxID=2949735 RepID=A0AA41YY09_9HYPH|nr:XdhC family protein [Lichenifustis flavocetrariae]MCW6509341.1 XdhC family protein [Lichenifustis flavocetrariae]